MKITLRRYTIPISAFNTNLNEPKFNDDVTVIQKSVETANMIMAELRKEYEIKDENILLIKIQQIIEGKMREL